MQFLKLPLSKKFKQFVNIFLMSLNPLLKDLKNMLTCLKRQFDMVNNSGPSATLLLPENRLVIPDVNKALLMLVVMLQCRFKVLNCPISGETPWTEREESEYSCRRLPFQFVFSANFVTIAYACSNHSQKYCGHGFEPHKKSIKINQKYFVIDGNGINYDMA